MLAAVIAYGEGFQAGQKDMQKRYFDLTTARYEVEEAETADEKLKIEAFWNGYSDGGMAYLAGEII